MAAKGAGVHWLKLAFHEMPDLVLTSALGICGLVLTGVVFVGQYRSVDENRKHKRKYTVLRAEDADPQLLKKNLYN